MTHEAAAAEKEVIDSEATESFAVSFPCAAFLCSIDGSI